MIIDKLYKECIEKSPICLGLDTKIEYLPKFLKENDMSISEKIFTFNKMIIDNTTHLVACFKVQIAFYEALGLEGLKAYSKTVKYIREKGKIVIGDIKRGDISSTAKAYAHAHFSGDFEVDIITVNPYMGYDSISPYEEYMKNNDKALFMLIHTSNKSSKDFQELEVSGEKLYMKVAEKCNTWGKDSIGESGFNRIGGVVGLTYPEEFLEIKKKCPNTFFLIPGYGAQGGKGEDIKEIFTGGICGVINSSRGIITAHKGKSEDENFINYIKDAVLSMKDDLIG